MRLTILFIFLSLSAFGQNPYNYGSYNYGGYNYGDKSLAISEIIVPGGSKEACYNGFFISGSDTLWKDISGHGRHAKIIGCDFWNDPEKDLGILPYRTKAIVTFPVSLLSFDLDSFMFDGNHTARQISPISMFQNIDYGNKLFCKEIAQQLNSDSTEVHGAGIRYFTVYSSVQTGANLTACNLWFGVPTESGTAFWVSKTGNDATGNGSKATPWLTIEKAYKTASAGSTVYVKSGVYIEEYNGTDTRYFYADKVGAFTIKGLGRTEIRTISTTYVIRFLNGSSLTIERIILNGEGNTNKLIDCYPSTSKIILNKCKLYGSSAYYINTASNAAVNEIELNNCSLTDAYKQIVAYDGVNITGCYLDFIASYVINFKYNKVRTAYTTAKIIATLANSDIQISFNDVSSKSEFVVITVNTSNKNVLIKNNNIKFNWTAGLGRNISLISGSSQYIIPTIQNNIISCSDVGLTDILYGIYLACTTPIIQNNAIEFLTMSQTFGIYIIASAYATGKCHINYNSIHSNTLNGILITLGNETALTGKFDESEIIGNFLTGHLLENPSTVASTHALFVNAGINCKIAYNQISYTYLGLVVKTGTGQTYTANGIYGNLFVNNSRDIWIRKAKGLLIANNTLYKTTTYNPLGGGRIAVDTYDTYTSEHDSLINNIIYSTDNNYKIYFDQAAADGGCKAYNTVLYNTASPLLVNATTLNFSQATAAGYFVDCQTTDPNFKSSTEFWPIPAITGGETLSSPYDYGLDISTRWGSATQTPVIILKQNTNGQIGAYGQ